MKNRFLTYLLAIAFMGTLAMSASAAAPTRDQLDFFEKKIRPLLSAKCYDCHSAANGKSRGGLVLDSKAGVLKGGDSGPSVVPGDPDKSLVITAVRYNDEDLQMPPKSKLTSSEIADLENWVRMGAPDPREGSVVVASAREVAAKHWAFQPIKNPPFPAAVDKSWEKTPIDRFALSAMKKKGLTPSPKADKRTLIRRATYDLTGLPPTVQEFDSFMADTSPKAWEKTIDRLLASPHYGERWGRHWMDVARYADSKGDVNGRNEDHRYPYAWTYRDYVIRSMNEDKPFDKFVKEQLAADYLVKNGQAKTNDLAALGFLTVGKRFGNNRNDIIDDRIDAVSKGFLGLTVVCARCHDHKFDPLPQADYYAWHGIFNSINEPGSEDDLPLVAPVKPTREYRDFLVELREIQMDYDKTRAEEEARIRKEAVENAGKYLFANWEVSQPTNTMNRFIFISTHRKLHTGVYERWRRYLSSKKSDDPVFGPWKAYAKLKPNEWAKAGKELTQKFSENRDEKNPINAVVARAIRANPPRNMGEVGKLYDDMFTQVGQQWLKAVAQASKRGRTPRPLEENLEEVKNVLFGEDRRTPSNPQGRDMYNLFSQGFQGRLQRIKSRMTELKMTHEGSPGRAMVVRDSGNGRDSRIFIRGDARNQGDPVPRRFLEALSDPTPKPFKIGSGRLELAEAIATRDNPLTARVIVNRIWMHHFGEGIVRSPSDFGTRSEEPTHPELLDWLATWFMDNGWSQKKLHKLIMMSNLYQQVSDDDPKKANVDPSNKLVWRYNVRRLGLEGVRDTLLAIGGKIDLTVGGKPVNLMEDPFPTRRTIYGMVDRRRLAPIYNTFDFANPDLSTAQRYQTTVPQQALFLMNNPLVVEQARNLVGRGDFRGRVNNEERVQLLYKLIYQRAPTEMEMKLATSYLQNQGNIELQAAYEAPWKYGVGTYHPQARKVTVFKQLPLFHEDMEAWYGGPQLKYVHLDARGGHPGVSPQVAVIRRWTAQADGVVEVDGSVRHADERGDGIHVQIVSGRSGLMGEWRVKNRTQQTRLPRVNVTKGDTIDFVVNCLRVPGADRFEWAPSVKMTRIANPKQIPANGATMWSATPDFTGPSKAVEARPLVAWEKYAQVLLLTNELTFFN